MKTHTAAIATFLAFMQCQPATAAEIVGTVSIDGEIIPVEQFVSYRLKESKKFEICDPLARKENVIDLWVASRQLEADNGLINGNNSSRINEFKFQLSGLTEDQTDKRTELELKILGIQQSSYLRFRDFGISREDVYDEYQRRVRDGDPYLVNVQVARVREIKKPRGSDWVEKRMEYARLIKNGTAFEEVAEQYPGDFDIPFQEDFWVRVDNLPHDIAKKNPKPGDIFGLDIILEGSEFFRPIVKIYEVKTLSQVRISDKVDANVDNPKVGIRLSVNPLLTYLSAKARERKMQLLMSELWEKHSITEEGQPIHRVGIYRPCSGF